MSEQDVTESTEAELPVDGPSARLVAAREKLGLTQKEVADKLYLTTAFIRYIDDGEFDRIPKPAFVKGYLRSYARIVELSGDEMVALYEAELHSGEQPPEIRDVTEEHVGTASITGPVLQIGLIGFIVLVLVGTLVWVLVSGDEEVEEPVVTQSNLPGPVVAEKEGPEEAFGYIGPSPQISAVAQMQFQEEASGTISSKETAQDVVPDPVEPVWGADPAPDTEPGESGDSAAEGEITIERYVDEGRRYINVNAGGSDQLELSFPGDCWVEIRDDQRRLVYNDLNRADDHLTIYGTAPFGVLLGKATGVEMIYNGRPFDLEPYISRDRTAKLTISE